MSPRLKLLSQVEEKLKNLENGTKGHLYGIYENNSVFVLGIIVTSQTENEEETDDHSDPNLVLNLPANVGICGLFKASTDTDVEKHLNEDLLENIKGIPVIISIDPTSKELKTYLSEDGVEKKAEHIIITKSDLLKSFLNIRATASVLLSCDFQPEGVEESITFIHDKISAGNASFVVEGSNVYILGESPDDINGISSDSTVVELLPKDSNGGNETEIVNVSLYMKVTNNETTPQLAPVIKYVKKVYKHAEISLSLDSLAMIPRQLKIKNLYPILVESICRNLVLHEKCLISQLQSGNVRDVSLPQTYHFLPQQCGHFLSIVYPVKKTPEQLKSSREKFHEMLSLPMDKPLLRKSNAYDFSKSVQKNDSKILLNPHEGLAKSGVPEGEAYFVQGLYAYHHYMQDDFDDSGWGCAYRSLQTIISWFRLQGYTSMPVPSHKEIQQCLVNIGDKPSSFVGSRQWIGSTEVSFVLDTMLGITCRIVSVSSGEEMTMKGGELSHHFKTQGTPIMIGGGVLAHTIIGIDYNKKTGAMKFLILDPHYTGSEDLKIIQNKGWCGWKGPEFWKKDAFYNMCLPLRPKCV